MFHKAKHDVAPVRSADFQRDWGNQVDPREYVLKYHSRGGGETPRVEAARVKEIRRQNQSYLRRLLDSDSNATVYVFATPNFEKQLEMAKTGDYSFQAWPGVSLQYAQNSLSPDIKQAADLQVVELRVHQPQPDDEGVLRWDCNATQTTLVGMHPMDQLPNLMNMAAMHDQITHTLATAALGQEN